MWNRLGNVIKSYLNDEDEKIFGKNSSRGPSSRRYSDPDLDAALDELNEFLNGKDASGESKSSSKEKDTQNGTAEPRGKTIPRELHRDFEELGLSPEASAEECKAAYKKLLKSHHPDRHAGNSEAAEKANEKAARINAAYDRLVKWFRSCS